MESSLIRFKRQQPHYDYVPVTFIYKFVQTPITLQTKLMCLITLCTACSILYIVIYHYTYLCTWKVFLALLLVVIGVCWVFKQRIKGKLYFGQYYGVSLQDARTHFNRMLPILSRPDFPSTPLDYRSTSADLSLTPIDLYRCAECGRLLTYEYNGRQFQLPPSPPKFVPLRQIQSCQCNERLTSAKNLFAQEQIGEAYRELAFLITCSVKGQDHHKVTSSALEMIVGRLKNSPVSEVPKKLLSKVSEKQFQQILEMMATKQLWEQLADVMSHAQAQRKLSSNSAQNIYLTNLVTSKKFCGQQARRLEILNMLLDYGARVPSRVQAKNTLLKALKHEEYGVVKRLIEAGVDPRFLCLQRGDTPYHAAFTIALCRDKGNFDLCHLLLSMHRYDPKQYPFLDPTKDKSVFKLVLAVNENELVVTAKEIIKKHRFSIDTSSQSDNNSTSGQVISTQTLLATDTKDQSIASQTRFQEGTDTIQPCISGYDNKLNTKSDVIDVPTHLGNSAATATVTQENSTYLENRNSQVAAKPSGMKSSQHTGLHATDRGVSRRPGRSRKPRNRRKQILRHHPNFQSKNVKGQDVIPVKSPPTPALPVLTPYEILSLLIKDLETDRSFNMELQSTSTELKRVEPSDHLKHTDNTTSKKLCDDSTFQAKSPGMPAGGADDEEDDKEVTEDDERLDNLKFADLLWEVECTVGVCKMMLGDRLPPYMKQRVVRAIKLLANGEWGKRLNKTISKQEDHVHLREAKLSKGTRLLWEKAMAFSSRLSGNGTGRGNIYTEIIRVWDIVLDHDEISTAKDHVVRCHKLGRQNLIKNKLKGFQNNHLKGGLKRRLPRQFIAAEDNLSHEDTFLYPLASISSSEFEILTFINFSDNIASRAMDSVDNKELQTEFPFRVSDSESQVIGSQSNTPILLLGRSGTGKTTCCLYRLWDRFQESKSEEIKLKMSACSHTETSGTGNKVHERQKSGAEIADPQTSCRHLRQLFVTKNQVLCSEMQRSFRAFCHGSDIAGKQVHVENNTMPHRLQDVHAYRYPLFMTSRQLLVMLDASLPPPYFFDRKADGSLKNDIPRWGDEDEIFANIPLEEDSDEETCAENHDSAGTGIRSHKSAAKGTKTSNNRREVTYEVFAYEIWPQIKNSQVNFHPSLVWMEITSFIKGSFQALERDSGYLDKNGYQNVGRKEASNFTGDREKVYEIFQHYQHYKKQHGLYDEGDLVLMIYKRLEKTRSSLPWLFHQVYVDETQDFTQAEMALLIRLSQNPNDMFFTGDSAQAIMRGVSFRFCYLKTLFYHAWKSQKGHAKTEKLRLQVEEHHLIYNYRSHTGILSLASGVLDLLMHFFPKSFDHLQRDQGFFNGPKPVLVCSELLKPRDLSMLLQWKRKKNSRIKFGARQVILVVNDESKNTLPEELKDALVLTIYESKGLEFDDVLLYNFFKDSQASKEWRVVTKSLETHEVLEPQAGLPPTRPLEFDHNRHKILNSELKHLYTAITRARVHLWICDEDEVKRAPMFYYMAARKLVNLNDASGNTETENSGQPIPEETAFFEDLGRLESESLDKMEWQNRGDELFQRKLYSAAAKCYRNAGVMHKERVASAYQCAIDATQNPGKSDKTTNLKIAILFLQSYSEMTSGMPALKSRVTLAKNAGLFIRRAREFELAARMYSKIGLTELAIKLYSRVKKWKSVSQIYEAMGDFYRAVNILCEKELYEDAFGCLGRYQEKDPASLMKNGDLELLNGEFVKGLRIRAAEFYSRRKQTELVLSTLQPLPMEEQIEFLRSHGYPSQAASLQKSQGKTLKDQRIFEGDVTSETSYHL